MASFGVTQPDRRHEQPAARAPRCRFRHEHDLPELGPGDLHWHLLHADDRRPVQRPSPQCVRRTAEPTACRPRWQRRRRTCRRSRRCSPPSSGYNPVQHLVGAATPRTPEARLSRRRWPGTGLLPEPDRRPRSARACTPAFDFAIAMSLLAAVASWTRGKRYVHTPAHRRACPRAGTDPRLVPRRS